MPHLEPMQFILVVRIDQQNTIRLSVRNDAVRQIDLPPYPTLVNLKRPL